MRKVIDAAVANDIAIEITTAIRFRVRAFIKTAKAAGAKSPSERTMPTQASAPRINPIQMVKQCGLVWQDIFVPKPAGQKPIQVKKWRTG